MLGSDSSNYSEEFTSGPIGKCRCCWWKCSDVIINKILRRKVEITFLKLNRSQRVVDTILQAFQICAASQGCMNNITIGDLHFGYYETVAGGSGAVSIALIQSILFL